MNNNPYQPDQPAQEPQSTYGQGWPQQPPMQPPYNPQQPSSPQNGPAQPNQQWGQQPPQYAQPQPNQQWSQQPPQYGQPQPNQQWGQQPPQYAVPDYARPQSDSNRFLARWLVSSLIIRLVLYIALPLMLCGGCAFFAFLSSVHR